MVNTTLCSCSRAYTWCCTLRQSSSQSWMYPHLMAISLNGSVFWEQFCISVHDRSSLPDSEKLIYLQHALKDGSAKHVIKGLPLSGIHYTEAVKCLTSRYNRLRLIHQTHVKTILEVPSLKEGTRKELHRLRDTVQQHLHTLKAMDYEPSGPFITSTLDSSSIPTPCLSGKNTARAPLHYQDLLEFINLRAQTSETSVADSAKKQTKHKSLSARKLFASRKPVALFAASTDSTTNLSFACKTEKHPLYRCTKFKSMPHDKKVPTLKTNDLCMNRLGPGHFVRQCKSLHRCKKCQKPHHTLLHVESQGETPPSLPPTNTTEKPVVSNTAVGLKSNSLLMTSHVLVSTPDGSSIEARAILDSASSASFISERLAESLCLPHSNRNARISGITGISLKSPIQSIANFNISAVRSSSKKIGVTAVIIPRVTCNLPLHPISFNLKWNHLSNLLIQRSANLERSTSSLELMCLSKKSL